jgi:hypothetical protein
MESWNYGMLGLKKIEAQITYSAVIFIPGLPTFHYSIIACGFSREW